MLKSEKRGREICTIVKVSFFNVNTSLKCVERQDQYIAGSVQYCRNYHKGLF